MERVEGWFIVLTAFGVIGFVLTVAWMVAGG
jgi:hypothetical protein